jgi:hypothetical protein
MRKPLGFTLVLALDAARLRSFEQSWPTWRQHRPEVIALNWIVIADAHQGTPDQWRRRLDRLDLPSYRLVCWGWPQSDEDDDGGSAPGLSAGPHPIEHPILQSERIATALLRVPAACCDTSHWILIDPATRAAKPPAPKKLWLDPRWFPRSGAPALVGQTQSPALLPPDVPAIQTWANRHEDTLLRRMPPLDPLDRYAIPAPWLLVVESGFGKLAAQLANHNRLRATPLHLYLWYLARRLELPARMERFDRVGWMPPEQPEHEATP